jgi:hypothetical protein
MRSGTIPLEICGLYYHGVNVGDLCISPHKATNSRKKEIYCGMLR